MATYIAGRKSMVRQVVEQVVEFHSEMTEQQRIDSIPVCCAVLTVMAGLSLTFAATMVWLAL